MDNEFMPFVVTRAPKPVSQDNILAQPVRVTIDPSELNTLGLTGTDKEKIYKKAKDHLQVAGVEYDVNKLPLPIASFINWYDAQHHPVTDEAFRQAITSVFRQDIRALINDAVFVQTKNTVIKGMLFAFIADNGADVIRSAMLRAFRFISAFETIASWQSFSPRRHFEGLLQRTVLLPGTIFPINFESAEVKKKRKELDEKKSKAVADIQKAINEKTQKLNDYRKAIDELLNAFDGHANNMVAPPAGIASVNVTRTVAPALTISPVAFNKLDKQTIDKLSIATKNILKKENISLDAVNVPATIKMLEDSSVRLLNEVKGLKDANPFTNAAVFVFDHIEEMIPIPGKCALAAEALPIEEAIDFPPKKGNGYVQRKYTGDLQKVRQTLKRYELGEIAYIENVMIGETKITKYRQLQKSEESTLKETETTQDSEKQMETNDQFQLQSQSARTISEDKNKEAGITVTATYGPVTATATGNIAVHNASEQSVNTSTNYAKDVIDRSLKRIKERVLNQTTRKIMQETERNQEHSFDNTNDNAEHINGIYQWVNKIYEVQVVNYGLRHFFEFVIADPAAFYRYALQNKPVEGMSLARPEKPGYCIRGTFYPLKPRDLNETSYLDWVERFNIPEVKTPPPRFRDIWFNKVYTIEQADGAVPKSLAATETASISIPKGYRVKGGTRSFAWARTSVRSTKPDDQVYFDVFMGDFAIISRYFTEFEAGGANGLTNYQEIGVPIPANELQHLSSDSTTELSIPVSVAGFSTLGLTINLGITLLCERSRESFEEWQIATYNQIMNAYNLLESEYRRDLENRQFSVFTSIQGRNPFTNREIEKTELKKQALAQFTGQTYESFHVLMQTDPITGFPEQNTSNGYLGGQFIQFFENAFEWQNMTYVFYDYFWSNKELWPANFSIEDIDPLFERFLRAGAARVQVPIRLGFSELVMSYNELQSGTSWSEPTAPLIDGHENTPPYISMLEEIKAQMNVDFRSGDGTITVAEGSHNVIGVGTEFTADDIDREIIINTVGYRIASVENELNLTLRNKYKKQKPDEAITGIGYHLGVKFVGEPWEIMVPTDLLYLNKKDPVNE